MKRLKLEGNKLLHHLDRLEPWLAGREIFPLYALVSPSLTCNHRCSFCVYHYLDRRRPRFLDFTAFAPVLEEMGACGVRGLLFSGEGEPLLNRDCPRMTETAATAGIDTALNTNGALFSRKARDRMLPLLKWVRFSVDAGDAHTYSRVHGVPESEFRKVLGIMEAAASEAARLPDPPTLGAQFLLLPENYESLPALAKILAASGIDYLAVKPFLLHPRTATGASPPATDGTPTRTEPGTPTRAKDEISSAKGEAASPRTEEGDLPGFWESASARTEEGGLSSTAEAGSFSVDSPAVADALAAAESAATEKFDVVVRREAFRSTEGRSYKTCLGADLMFEIDSAGNLIPCGPLMGEPEFVYGNIHDGGFREIWTSERCRSLRKSFREEFDVRGCMPGCRNDSVNRFLWRLRHPPVHVNFI